MRWKDGGRGTQGRKSGCLAICEEKDGEEEEEVEMEQKEEEKEEEKIGIQSHLQGRAARREGCRETHSGMGMLN